MTQAPTQRCDCGRDVFVVQRTPYEFNWYCVCKRAGSISWAHANPPPDFHVKPRQAELFR